MGAKLWVAYVDDESTPLYPIHHCTEETEYVFDFQMQRTEGQSAEFQVTTWEYGWKRLADLSTRFAIASWSPTGNPNDARLIARGYRVELPGDFGQDEQMVRYRCEKQDTASYILSASRSESRPEVDLRFSDADPDDAETYLLGRCADWYVDPGTHAYRLSDSLVGKRVVDLSAHVLGPISDSPGSFGEPITRMTAKVDVTWSQEAKGLTDMSSRIDDVTSYDPALAGRVSGSISSGLSQGWSLVSEPRVRRKKLAPTSPISASYHYKAVYRSEVFAPAYEQASGSPKYESIYKSWQPLVQEQPEGSEGEAPPLYTSDVHGDLFYEVYSYSVDDVVLSYEYSQPRREVLTVTLEGAIHPALVNRTRPEVVTENDAVDMNLTLADPADDSVVDALEIGKTYVKGDRVTIGGRVYRAAYDQVGEATWPVGAEPWILEVGNAGRVQILDVDGGKSIVEHVLLRMRKQILRSSRAKNLTFTVPWEIGWDVTTEDSASVMVPWDEETDRLATGKVVSTSLHWDEDGDATVAIEIGISFGQEMEAAEGSSAAFRGMSYQIGKQPPVVVPVDTFGLGSSFTAATTCRWRDDRFNQATEMGRLRAEGQDPAQGSVTKATRLDLKMKPLTVREELHRDLTASARLLSIPSGIDLTMED